LQVQVGLRDGYAGYLRDGWEKCWCLSPFFRARQVSILYLLASDPFPEADGCFRSFVILGYRNASCSLFQIFHLLIRREHCVNLFNHRMCEMPPLVPRTRGKTRRRRRALSEPRDSAAALLPIFLCFVLACNIFNLFYKSQPALFNGFARDCKPNFVFYPDYQRSLGFPIPILDTYFPPRAAIREALDSARACLDTNRLQLNPGLKDLQDDVPEIIRALEDAGGKLHSWSFHPWWMFNVMDHERHIRSSELPMDVSFPHYKTEGCAACTWNQASRTIAYKLMMPYKLIMPYWGYSNKTPHTWNDFAKSCPPCSIATLLEGWRQVVTFRILPYPHVEWNADVLPPRGVHDFYFTHVFDTMNPLLFSLARWGRAGARDLEEMREKRHQLAKWEKLDLIEKGWLEITSFREDDDDIAELRQQEADRIAAIEEPKRQRRVEKIMAEFEAEQAHSKAVYEQGKADTPWMVRWLWY